MKLIALFLALTFTSMTFAGAPMGVSGQNATSSFYPSVIQAPNNQVTDIGSGKGLFEHGNKNILVNPSFEHKTLGSGWTSSGTGTSSAESAIVIDGKKSYKVVMSAQTLNLSQSSTLYAAQFNGTVQGLAMVRVKSNVALTICAVQAGVVSTTLCVTTATDNNWGLYKIPFILSATSNGISIVSASATGTAYIDDAFVGAVDLKVDGSVVNSQSLFLTQSASFTNASITGTLTSNTGDTTLVSYNSSTGVYTVNRKANIHITATMDAGGAVLVPTIMKGATNIGYDYGAAGEASANVLANSGDTFVVKNGSSNATTNQIITVLATEITANSNYSSSCGANCVNDYSATVSAAGVVSDENVDFINGNCSITSTSTYDCPIGLAPALTSKLNCSMVADVIQGDDVLFAYDRTNSSTTNMRFNTKNATNSAVLARPFTIVCQKAGADFVATRTIVGSFKEVPTTIGSSGVDFQSVYFGSGASCATQCTTGTCSICTQVGSKITSVSWASTGAVNINGIDGTKYICSGGGLGAGATYLQAVQDKASSTSSLARMIASTDLRDASITCIGIP